MDEKIKSPVMVLAGKKAHRKKLDNLIAKLSGHDLTDLKELAEQIYQREYNWQDQCDRDALICKYADRTTWNSFCSFGDRNHASQNMILHWIRSSGTPLDLQALTMATETGMDVTPDEFAHFIATHECGHASFPYHQQTNELRKIFREIAGHSYTIAFRKFLDQGNTPKNNFPLSSVDDWWTDS